ncbi:thioredoxin-dependent thiol peroxidase [Kordia sp. SMS9]|uniref:peroxiredoxin family protein n=1 Tax=Kordia sp. SMS9 TaxID=2282170 RepID=UPI000E0DBCCF|nr:redoxin domain-containing protein [Kordia sp. SMS9]AXG70115.1 thioredoxin-dependent thiol peroxidase [Kordia sp. SMS9]
MSSLLKSIFISAFPVFALVVMIDCIWFMFDTEITLVHAAHVVTAASIVFYFIRIFVKPLARTDSVLIVYTFCVFLGFLMSFLLENLQGNIVIRAFCMWSNLTLTIGWIAYLLWYSFFQERSAESNILLSVGNSLPLLRFENAAKEEITTEKFAGTPSIFIFYRGNWCPFCMAQIKEMVEKHEELLNRNINTVFISSQPHSFSKKLTKKYPLDFQFLVDVHGNVAKQLHIFAEHGLPFGFQIFGFKSHTTLPTIIITDSNEKIVYTNQTDNYRVRPEPKTLLKIVDEQV